MDIKCRVHLGQSTLPWLTAISSQPQHLDMPHIVDYQIHAEEMNVLRGLVNNVNINIGARKWRVICHI